MSHWLLLYQVNQWCQGHHHLQLPFVIALVDTFVLTIIILHFVSVVAVISFTVLPLVFVLINMHVLLLHFRLYFHQDFPFLCPPLKFHSLLVIVAFCHFSIPYHSCSDMFLTQTLLYFMLLVETTCAYVVVINNAANRRQHVDVMNICHACHL